MSVTLSTGATLQIAGAYGDAFTISAISNANPAVATLSASHGVVVGDYIEVNTGWDLLNNRVVRVSAVATNDVTLEGIDTSDTDRYPSGSSAGDGREITAASLKQITQITGVDSGGGQQEYTDVTTLSDRVRKQRPTVRAAQTLDLTVLDDPAQAYYATVVAAAEASALTAMVINYSDGSKALLNGYWSIQKTPRLALNAPLTAQISFSAAAEATRYAS